MKLTLIFSNYGQNNQPFLVSWCNLLRKSAHLKVCILSYQIEVKTEGVESFIPESTSYKIYRFIKHWLQRFLKIQLPEFELPKLREVQGICHILNAQQFHGVAPHLQKNVRTVCSFRGYETVVRYAEDERWRPRLHDIFKKVHALHFVSDYLKNEAIALGAPAEKCKTIYRSVDIDFFAPEPRAARDGKKIILSAGRLTWQKGFRHALEAIALLSKNNQDFHYIIVGEGEEGPKLKLQIISLGLENKVEILPHVSHDTLKALYQSADILLVSSVSEALPNVILEASAMALPIVATHVGGIPEAIVEGETGLLVEPSKPKDMAEALLRLLSDADLRLAMGNAGRTFIKQKFGPTPILEQWEDFYKKMNA